MLYKVDRVFISKQQRLKKGGALGTILASIGIPMAIDLVKNLVSSGSAPRMGTAKSSRSQGGSAPRLGIYRRPPPFIGSWLDGRIYGRGKKKISKEKRQRERKKGKRQT